MVKMNLRKKIKTVLENLNGKKNHEIDNIDALFIENVDNITKQINKTCLDLLNKNDPENANKILKKYANYIDEDNYKILKSQVDIFLEKKLKKNIEENVDIVKSINKLIEIYINYKRYQDANNLLNKYKNYLNAANFESLQNRVKKQKISNKNVFQAPLKSHKKKNSESVFEKAERAREEKDFAKAESFYAQAITENDNPASAVANLVTLLYSQKRYDEAADWLGKYGFKIMRATTYRNIKQQLFSAKPELEEKITELEQSSSTKSDYFRMANTAVEQKDFQKAINDYKMAINLNQEVSSSVSCLVSLYIRLEMIKEAKELLEQHQKNLKKNTYLNLKLSIFNKSKNYDDLDEIIKVCDALITNANNLRKCNLIMEKARLYAYFKKYEESIVLYKDCINNKWPFNTLKDTEYTKIKIYALNGIINAYYNLGDKEIIKQYANELLEIAPESNIAISVISGEYNNEKNLLDDPLIDVESTNISNIFKTKMNSINLEDELKNSSKYIEDGKFTGSQRQARIAISSILKRRDDNASYAVKSNLNFAIAKILRQVLDSDDQIEDKKYFSEQNYLNFILDASFQAGNSNSYNHNVTLARYYYLQVIKSLKDKKNKMLYVSVIRYIQTFFKFETLAIVNFENKTLSDAINEILEGELNTDAKDFVLGMLELLKYYPPISEDILKYLYSFSYKAKVFDFLSVVLDNNLSDGIIFEKFQEIWNSAIKKYDIKVTEFINTFNETIDNIFYVGELENNIEKLRNFKTEELFNVNDQSVVLEFYQICNNISRYNEISEFEYKIETLMNSYKKVAKLEEKIIGSLTTISYDKMFEGMDSLYYKIYNEGSILYGNYVPQISVSAGSATVREKELIVLVPLAFKNKINVQTADNFSYKINGKNVEIIDDAALSKAVLPGDGKSDEKMIKLHISQQILEDKEFSLVVSIKYQYKKNMTEVEEKTEDFPISIKLYNDDEFVKIENKFEPHRNGATVTDDSMFYGRDKEIENIIAQISDENGNILKRRCLALYGQTRTGKTSLLYHIRKRLREKDLDSNIIIDIGSIGEEGLEGDDITDFLFALLDSLEQELKNNHKDLYELLKQNDIDINPNRLLETEKVQLLFNNIFKNFMRLIESQDKNYNVIIMIDEFTYIYDWIRQGKMTDKFMKFWKSFIQNNDIFAIIIGQDHMMKFVNEKEFTNDFGSTDLRKVSYLAEEEAKKLMYEPIMYVNKKGEKINRYKDEALDRLYELTSGSAFLIVNLCAGLVDYLNENHSVYITKATIDDYLKQNLPTFEESRYFEPQYNDKSDINSKDNINEKNKKILRLIAKYSNKKEWALIENVAKNDDDLSILENLRERDVITISDKRCKIKVALYKEWILAKYGQDVSEV